MVGPECGCGGALSEGYWKVVFYMVPNWTLTENY